MAKSDTLKQLEMIAALKNRVQSILDELEVLRKSIAESEKAYNPSSAKGVTLDDVFNVLQNGIAKVLVSSFVSYARAKEIHETILIRQPLELL